ncbi:hypothetical protein F5146DRAFT_52951 [Armillaria mellea]|nr:hypothetical protein F5146DRAFT_346742 [Armillaria mellea]KAK0197589.1 hypothetical protein F5146DRAFT_52951 [Armillaria mellea]
MSPPTIALNASTLLTTVPAARHLLLDEPPGFIRLAMISHAGFTICVSSMRYLGPTSLTRFCQHNAYRPSVLLIGVAGVLYLRRPAWRSNSKSLTLLHLSLNPLHIPAQIVWIKIL